MREQFCTRPSTDLELTQARLTGSTSWQRAAAALLMLTMPASASAAEALAQRSAAAAPPPIGSRDTGTSSAAVAPAPQVIERQAEFTITKVTADGDFVRTLEIRFLNPELGTKQFVRQGDSNGWISTHTAGSRVRQAALYGSIMVQNGWLWHREAPGFNQPTAGAWTAWRLPKPEAEVKSAATASAQRPGAGTAGSPGVRQAGQTQEQTHALLNLLVQDGSGREKALREFLPPVSGRVIVVHFGAPWCPACGPDLQATIARAKEAAGKVQVVNIDIETDDAPIALKPPEDGSVHLKVHTRNAEKLGIEMIPYNQILVDGALVPLKAGEVRGKEFLAGLDAAVGRR